VTPDAAVAAELGDVLPLVGDQGGTAPSVGFLARDSRREPEPWWE
jgi:hypothetical protein